MKFAAIPRERFIGDIRMRFKSQRASTINLLRGVLREFGLAIPLGRPRFVLQCWRHSKTATTACPMALRHTLGELLDRLTSLQAGNMRFRAGQERRSASAIVVASGA